MTYPLQPPDPIEPSASGHLSARYEFTGQERALDQFFIRLKLIHRWQPDDAADPVGRWADLFSLMPTVPPGDFERLAAGLMPPEQIRSIEALLRRFREIKQDVVNGLDVTELGPDALETLRLLSLAAGAHRFSGGEQFVIALKLAHALPASQLEGLELIQVRHGVETLDDGTFIQPQRLVYLLPFDPADATTAQRWSDRWHEHARRIESQFQVLLPGWHASVELRDRDAVTMAERLTIGPGCVREEL